MKNLLAFIQVNNVIGKAAYYLLVIVLLNFTATNLIAKCLHPELTETQIAIRMPKSFVWDF